MKKVVANLKMNFSLEEILEYRRALDSINTEDVELIVCPSYPFLHLFNNSKYHLGAQDVSAFIEGSKTGEVSAKQLASLNVEYVIINHSERKKVSLVNDNLVLDKIKNALANNLKVILCIGETLEERKKKQTKEVLRNFIQKIFSRINSSDFENICIAYEPEWAIGTGMTPEASEIYEIFTFIKKEVSKFGNGIEVLYGGSINGYNIVSLRQIPTCGGFLVGKSSLSIKELNDICQMNKETY